MTSDGRAARSGGGRRILRPVLGVWMQDGSQPMQARMLPLCPVFALLAISGSAIMARVMPTLSA
ncbi:MAG: hypothetical protein CMP09_21530 [Yangia sp.]|nr:hypothetical protein [Salipiger sp.]